MKRLSTALQLALILPITGCEQPKGDAPRPASSPHASSRGVAAPDGHGLATSAPRLPTSLKLGSTRAASSGCSPTCLSIERCDVDSGKCKPSCPAGEVYVPATSARGFSIGRAGRGSGKRDRPHKVVLTKPFCMDATEVTVKAYKACVQARVCEPPRSWGLWATYPKQLDHPVNKVHWQHAKAYCQFKDKSLPTEAQWEWAATGGDGRSWAWGNGAPTCEHADFTSGTQRTPASNDGCDGGGPSPVGSHPKGDRIWPTGRIHDMSGNVWEWCLDNLATWTSATETDPLHLSQPAGVHVVRGGGWNRSGEGIRVHYRGGAVVDYQVPGLGFRCVRNPRPAG